MIRFSFAQSQAGARSQWGKGRAYVEREQRQTPQWLGAISLIISSFISSFISPFFPSCKASQRERKRRPLGRKRLACTSFAREAPWTVCGERAALGSSCSPAALFAALPKGRSGRLSPAGQAQSARRRRQGQVSREMSPPLRRRAASLSASQSADSNINQAGRTCAAPEGPLRLPLAPGRQRQ